MAGTTWSSPVLISPEHVDIFLPRIYVSAHTQKNRIELVGQKWQNNFPEFKYCLSHLFNLTALSLIFQVRLLVYLRTVIEIAVHSMKIFFNIK